MAYGATFGASHPHNFQVVDYAPALELEAEYMAVLRVLETVPTNLTAYVVFSSQCYTDVLLNIDYSSLNGW